MAFLAATSGPELGRRYELSMERCILGRHPDCQIQIEVGAVSRHHAQISREGDGFYVEDLKSRNGTFLNDEAVQGRQKLQHGDRVRVCDVSFVFHERDVDEQPSDNSSFRTVLVDDEGTSNSTIMSKLDVSSSRGRVQLVASPEAKLAALVEITLSLGKALSLDEVLPQVLNSLFKIFVQADRGFIALVGEDGVLVPRWTKLRREDADTIRVSRTIVHQVMQSREAILSADATSDARFELSQSIADFRIRSMMCAPLINSEGTVLGVLQIDTLDQRNRFQPEDLELLVGAAAQAGIAIDNAQMHEAALRQRAVERDLELAHEVQRGFLPDARPELPGYHFWDYYRPANHVGGDYFDYIRLPDGRLAVLVADVVGHGVAAALLMAKLSAEARYCLATADRPADAVTKLNQRISRLNIERFVTLITAVLDTKKHEITIVNAGHMAPIIKRSDGRIEEPGEGKAGLPLGIMEDLTYEQETVPIAPGEQVILYTDGVNETVNAKQECYGIDRLRKHAAAKHKTPESLGETIVQDVRRFLSSGTQEDDMCLVCLARSE